MNSEVVDITAEFVTEAVDAFLASKDRKRYIENMEYFKGQNPVILTRKSPDGLSGPDNRVPIPYGRRIINLVTGYMYKPGLVQYSSEDEAYYKELMKVFDANYEPIKTEQVGKQVSIQGVGYEYHYVVGDEKGGTLSAVPKFTKLPAHEVIPIYDYEVEPNLWAFIRVISRGDDQIAWAYDKAGWRKYRRGKDDEGAFSFIEEGKHYYHDVPLVVYENNEERIGDVEPVTHLIDAYDVLVSDSMNEFDRFAWAYLVMKGMSLTDESAEKIKRLRTFENLAPEDSIEFLTKDMATEFIAFMTGLIRDEIHRQSGIPNLEDYDGAGASGKTMTKFIYLMELFTDPKESYFKRGLHKRIELIDRIMRFGMVPGRVDITMNRNTPDNSLEQAEVFNAYAGGVSLETRLENFADFVDNVDEEIDKLTKEKDEAAAMLYEEIQKASDDGEPTGEVSNEPVDANIQAKALNGAQITSLLEIVMQVASGTLTPETARALIDVAFPDIEEAEISAILSNVKKVKPSEVSGAVGKQVQ